MTTSLVILFITIGIFGSVTFWFLLRFSQKGKPTAKEELIYIESPIFTKGEEEKFKRLCTALPGFYIFPKVAVATLLIPGRTTFKRNNAAFEKFTQMAVDFVVYDADFELVCIVDLERMEGNGDSDSLIDSFFKKAGIKRIRWDADARAC